MPKLLRLTGRSYRTLPTTSQGYEPVALELEADRTALVVLHCWNIGCEDGPEEDPDYWVGMGFSDTVREAARIMREVIRPALDAARAAGLCAAHVECELIGARHPEAQRGIERPAKSAARSAPGPGPVVPGYASSFAEARHGVDYANRPPYSAMDRAEVVAPAPGEIYAYRTRQLDALLRERGIQNLIYAGFAADMCILNAPGGVQAMFALGYRVYLMRDATLGVEFPDTFAERLSTRWGIRFHETHFGHTLTSVDFIAACRELA